MGMASFTIDTLQHQTHFLCITLSNCKYPSPFTASNFLPFSHFLCPKHKLSQLFIASGRHVRLRHQFHAKLSTKDYEQTSTTKSGNSKGKNETGSGFNSKERNSLENLLSSVMEGKGEKKRYVKDKNNNNARKRDRYVDRRRGKGSGNSSLRDKDEDIGIKMKHSRKVENLVAKENVGDGVVVAEKKVGKRSKKDKANNSSPEVPLRVQLDMCSKRGDVMGAIQLYDKALREGISMGQYQYAVLLYLCASAAVGVVQPAKSGSGNRPLNMLNLPNEALNTSSTGLGDSIDNRKLVDSSRSQGNTDEMEDKLGKSCSNLDDSFPNKNLIKFPNGSAKHHSQLSEDSSYQKEDEDGSDKKDGSSSDQEDNGIWVTEDVKKYALRKGFEIYEKMCLDNVPMNEATLTAVARMAMSMGNGDMAFDMVKQMKQLGINPRLRSYGPALSVFCNTGDVDKAFDVEKHMLENCVHPEEAELEALLRVSVEAGKGDKVYYLLHKLRTSVRKVLPSTADLIVKWFESKAASRVGKRSVDQRTIKEAIENGGGGWHGQGWLGRGKWNVSHTAVGADALCKCCGEKLALIDLDPVETEKFAESVASIAIKREKNFSFQKFQV